MMLDNPTPNPPASEPQPAPAEPVVPPASPYADPGAVLVIPRVMVNYVIIAIVFFALGAGIAALASNAIFSANSAENQALIQRSVAAAVEASGGQQQARGLQPGQRYDVSTDNDPSRGPEDAPVTIVEFSDFRCPYCGRFVAETLDPLLANYAGKVRMVYRDFPILGQESLVAALAGECMNDQGKFWEFHNLTFSNQQSLSREQFISYAQQLGIDVPRFTTCLDNQEFLDEIRADATYAQNLGVTGTPAFFINGTFVSGAQPYEVFASIIDQELAKAANPDAAPSGS